MHLFIFLEPFFALYKGKTNVIIVFKKQALTKNFNQKLGPV